MPNKNDQSLEERIEHLEQLVDKLSYTVERLQEHMRLKGPPSRTNFNTQFSRPPYPPRSFQNGASPVDRRPGPPARLPDSGEATPAANKDRPMYALNSDEWLNRIGLGLLFLGVGLALKYTFAQEWFTPILRIMSGSFVGLLLLAVGLHFHRIRPRFGQLLLGGGVATFYLTAFGAYQLYQLIPYSIAFVILFIITAFSFWLSAQRDDAILAILATTGGLITPFIMHAEGDNLIGLISYTSLILIGASAIYWFRGWRSLLFIASIGAWLVILLCYLNFGFRYESISAERWTLQIGLLIGLALFWLMPVYRGVLGSANPEKWPSPPPVRTVGYFFNHPALPLSVTTPLTTLVLSMLIWDLPLDLWGWITLLGSALHSFLYFLIRTLNRPRLNHISQIQGFTASVLLAVGLFFLLGEPYLFLALTLQAVGLRALSRSMSDRWLSFVSHGFFLCVAAWLVNRLIQLPADTPPLFNTKGLFELLFIVAAAVTYRFVKRTWTKRTYLVVSHLLFLGLIYREFHGVPDGEAIVSTIWGIYAIAILLLGLKLNRKSLRYTGLYTLSLFVLKLLLIDLEEVDPLIRILLFVGFGVIFMILSYVVTGYLKRTTGATPSVSQPASEAHEPVIRESRSS